VIRLKAPVVLSLPAVWTYISQTSPCGVRRIDTADQPSVGSETRVAPPCCSRAAKN
jgi:hypothetical protein